RPQSRILWFARSLWFVSRRPRPGRHSHCAGIPSPIAPAMQVVITAVGPDNRGLADPIIHHVTGLNANIAEIQMYDHDELSLFAMLLRIELPEASWPGLRPQLLEIGKLKGLSVRVWSPEERRAKP